MRSGAVPREAPEAGHRLGLGGPGLTRGLVVGYLSMMVLLPIAAVAATSLEGGIGGVLGRGHRRPRRSRP